MADSQNHYDMLGVLPTADAVAIKRAYYNKMRQYHPDNFVAERKRLEAAGDKTRLRALDVKIDDAKKRTQRINAAYTVLSDPERRRAYDRQRTTPKSVSYNPEYEPRTTRVQRPHSARPNAPQPPKEDRLPVALAIGFLVVLALSLSVISTFFRGEAPSREFVMTQTVLYIPSGSTDATASAWARRPSPTPRSVENFANAGDALFDLEQYQYAVEQYSHAISHTPRDATLYFRRGRAFAALQKWGDALHDFDYALELMPEWVEVYRERGLTYYARWRTTTTADDADAARADLAQYVAQGGEVTAEMEAALNTLPD